MLLNRFLSLTVLLSVAGSVFAAPVPRPRPAELEPLGLAEVEIKQDDGNIEAELEREKGLVPFEVEVETLDPTARSKRTRLAVRSHANRSLASSVLVAQQQLDALTPQIEQAMLGPLGSIEKATGENLLSVSEVTRKLEADMKMFVGDEDAILYLNPEGTGQLSKDELAKMYSKFFLASCISDIEGTVKHVSGFAVTSAQQDIKNDLLSMKTTLRTLAPEVGTAVASTLVLALSMGTGAAGVMARV
ncbi:hypothetical protein FRC12_015208 [Ceratobasidium sp. 428]|nr:hypothetical protein FRC12_015208 [Ceratobasidium sp. 428]